MANAKIFPPMSEREIRGAEISRYAASAGMVLLKNRGAPCPWQQARPSPCSATAPPARCGAGPAPATPLTAAFGRRKITANVDKSLILLMVRKKQYKLSKRPVNVPKTVRLTNGLTHGGAGDTAASNSGSRAREGPGPSRRSLVPSKGNPWSLP